MKRKKLLNKLSHLGPDAVADPDLQIRGGGGGVGHPDPEISGEWS